MQRFPLKFRQNLYNEGDFYQLIPVARRPVAPGERLSKIAIDIRYVSAIFEKANLTPLLAQIWAFYVPHRIVWNQWVDFIAMDPAVVSVPTTTTAAPGYFEPGTGSKSSLFRRSYKAIYNQYFGDETQAANGAFYTNPDDDTVVTFGRLLVWDQYRSHQRYGTYVQNNFTAAVSGATATIPLDDLRRALRSNDARRKQVMSGDKYVDTMRLMGVELDWRVQMAPEFLGSSQQVLFSEVINSANSVDLTVRASEWKGMCQLVVKRPLAFAEHGYVIVLAGFRPCVALDTAAAPEVVMTTNDHFYRPDTASGPLETQGGGQWERNTLYLKGRNAVGQNLNGNVFTQPVADIAILYPNPANYTPAATSGPRHMAMLTDASFGGLTPVPSTRA